MNTILRRLLPPVLMLGLVLTAHADGDNESLEFVSPPLGGLFIRWHSVIGRTYFVQVSYEPEALATWTFAPAIESGHGGVIQYELDEPDGGLPEKGFFRLKYTDQVPGPNEDEDTADFDGDGLSNRTEVEPGGSLAPTDPLNPDTDGDGLPDGWERAHGLNPNDSSDAANIFPGSNLSNLQAFNTGVQGNPNATVADKDGDGAENIDDADPDDGTIDWKRTADPMFAVIELPATDPNTLRLDDFSENGTVLFTRLSSQAVAIERLLVDREINPHILPMGAGGLGEFGGYGPTLIGDLMLGYRNVQGLTEQCTWDPLDDTYVGFQWNGYHDDISDVRGNFRVDRTGTGLNTPQGLLANSQWSNARIEQNGNIVSDNGNYWRFNPDTSSYGSRSSLTESSIRSSATLTQTEPDPQGSGEITRAWHLIPGSTRLHVSKEDAPFVKSHLILGSSRIPLGVTNQGWVATASEIWSNGTWHSLPDLLAGNKPTQAILMGILDTGAGVARFQYGSEQPTMVLLIPVDLDVNGDGDLDDSCDGLATYMPGYKGDQAMLHTGDSFKDVQYAGPQEMKLIVSGLGTSAVDSATFKILNPTSYFGYCGNAIAKGGTPEDEAINSGTDFSFEAAGDDIEIEGTVEADRIWVPIYCRDYGAWCEVEITLKKNGAVIGGPIKLTLPLDNNRDKLADLWQHGEIQRWNQQFRLTEGDAGWRNPDDPSTWSPVFGSNGTEDAELPDSDGDAGPMPAMTDKGDGLSALDEYRGFFLDGGPGITTPKHRRLFVARKELLVECSEMEGIASTTLRLPPGDAFTDQGNDPNAFAQGYSLNATMDRISAFFAKEGPATGSNPKYFPGAAIDTWWVKDRLNDIGYVVYQDGSMGSTHKYSGPYTDMQNSNAGRNGWLSITWNSLLWSTDRPAHNNLYGGGQGVAVLAHYNNRNDQCRDFIKLTVQGRKGFVGNDGGFYTKVNEAAREQDERGEPDRLTYQGSAMFVNSLSEEQGVTNQTAFMELLEYSFAHELAHLFVGNDGDHFAGDDNVLSVNRGTSLPTGFVQDEITNTKLRQRASINRDANGKPQP